MHKPVLAVAAVVASVLLLPLVGTLLGIAFTVLKFAVIGGLLWFVFWFLTRKKDKGGEAPAE